MWAWVSFLLACLFAGVLQVGCLWPWRQAWLHPEVLSLLAVHALLIGPRRSALAMAGVAGLLADQLTLGPPGVRAGVYVVAGAWLVSQRSWLLPRSSLTGAVAVVGLCFAALLFELLVMHLQGGGAVSGDLVLRRLIGVPLASAMLMLAVRPLLLRWRIGQAPDSSRLF